MSRYNPAYRRPMATIVCACGATRLIRRSRLQKINQCARCALSSGMKKSAEKRGSSPETKASNNAWSEYRCNARSRGLVFEITKEQFLSFRASACHYCGIEGPSGIDRLDSDAGYSLGNVVSCCSTCNYAKRGMQVHEFIGWVARVHEHQSFLQRDRSVLLFVAEQSHGPGSYQARHDQRQVDCGFVAERGERV